MNNAGLAAATGNVATGVALGMMMAEGEKDQDRRRSHMGKDQILIEVKDEIDKVGKKLATLYNNWYYNGSDKHIYRDNTWLDRITKSTGVAIIVTLLAIVIQVSIFFTFVAVNGFFAEYPMSTSDGLLLSIVLGCCGFLVYVCIVKDTQIDYIQLTAAKGKTRVLVKVYDSSGYRNVNEDKLAEILDILG